MTLENPILTTYCFVDSYLKKSNLTHLRKRREPPALSDAEVITFEIVGKYLGHGSEKKSGLISKNTSIISSLQLIIARVFQDNMLNLSEVKKKLQESVSSQLSTNQNLYLCDGFPIPVCHIKRYKRSKSDMKTPSLSTSFISGISFSKCVPVKVG